MKKRRELSYKFSQIFLLAIFFLGIVRADEKEDLAFSLREFATKDSYFGENYPDLYQSLNRGDFSAFEKEIDKLNLSSDDLKKEVDIHVDLKKEKTWVSFFENRFYFLPSKLKERFKVIILDIIKKQNNFTTEQEVEQSYLEKGKVCLDAYREIGSTLYGHDSQIISDSTHLMYHDIEKEERDYILKTIVNLKDFSYEYFNEIKERDDDLTNDKIKWVFETEILCRIIEGAVFNHDGSELSNNSKTSVDFLSFFEKASKKLNNVNFKLEKCSFYNVNPYAIDQILFIKTRDYLKENEIFLDKEKKFKELGHQRALKLKEFLSQISHNIDHIKIDNGLASISKKESPQTEGEFKLYQVRKRAFGDFIEKKKELAIFSDDDKAFIFENLDLVCDGDPKILEAVHFKIPELLFKPIFGLGQTCLHRAAQNGNSKNLQLLFDRYLDQYKLFINKQDFIGMTPLHWAVAGNHQEAVEFIIESAKKGDAHAIDLNTLNLRFESPLYTAAIRGNETLARYLIGHGAELVNQKSSSEKSVLEAAVKSGNLDLAKYLSGLKNNLKSSH